MQLHSHFAVFLVCISSTFLMDEVTPSRDSRSGISSKRGIVMPPTLPPWKRASYVSTPTSKVPAISADTTVFRDTGIVIPTRRTYSKPSSQSSAQGTTNSARSLVSTTTPSPTLTNHAGSPEISFFAKNIPVESQNKEMQGHPTHSDSSSMISFPISGLVVFADPSKVTIGNTPCPSIRKRKAALSAQQLEGLLKDMGGSVHPELMSVHPPEHLKLQILDEGDTLPQTPENKTALQVRMESSLEKQRRQHTYLLQQLDETLMSPYSTRVEELISHLQSDLESAAPRPCISNNDVSSGSDLPRQDGIETPDLCDRMRRDLERVALLCGQVREQIRTVKSASESSSHNHIHHQQIHELEEVYRLRKEVKSQTKNLINLHVSLQNAIHVLEGSISDFNSSMTDILILSQNVSGFDVTPDARSKDSPRNVPNKDNHTKHGRFLKLQSIVRAEDTNNFYSTHADLSVTTPTVRTSSEPLTSRSRSENSFNSSLLTLLLNSHSSWKTREGRQPTELTLLRQHSLPKRVMKTKFSERVTPFTHVKATAPSNLSRDSYHRNGSFSSLLDSLKSNLKLMNFLLQTVHVPSIPEDITLDTLDSWTRMESRVKRGLIGVVLKPDTCQTQGDDIPGTNFISLCSSCLHTTVLDNSYFPRFLNEKICQRGTSTNPNNASGCLRENNSYGGVCRQQQFHILILRRVPGQCMKVMAKGQELITDKWERIPHVLRVGCECAVRTNSQFAKYVKFP